MDISEDVLTGLAVFPEEKGSPMGTLGWVGGDGMGIWVVREMASGLARMHNIILV
jgi:CubicO group peptidase (beta-lactamase class C family)